MRSSRPVLRRVAGLTATALVVGVVPFVAAAPNASAAPTELFFSEYIEGSSNNKALEIYNGTGASVNLATGGYNVQIFSNGGTTASGTINLTGTVANGDAYVVANSTSTNDPALLTAADQLSGSVTYNGNDAVVLRQGTTVIDVIGQIGNDPGAAGWGVDPTNTTDNTIRRKATVLGGDSNGSDAFDPAVEWVGFAQNTFDGLGSHTVIEDQAPTVASTSPANGANAVSTTTDITVSFSEPVEVADGWYTISCSVSGDRIAVVSGGPTIFTLDPTSELVNGDTCTLTVVASAVRDQDAVDPPDLMSADRTVSFIVEADPCSAPVVPITPIPAIQGGGLATPIPGTLVTTKAVVVGDHEGLSPALRGFYVQDPEGDDDPATSDGIFVFAGNTDRGLQTGDVVRVTGTVSEFQDQTQVSANGVVACGTGTVAPTEVTFPVASATFLERYEGMLVTLPQTMTVTEHFQLGRFGQVVLSQGGRLQQPTNVVSPGAPALALQQSNDLRKIILDDSRQNQNPDPIVWSRDGGPLTADNTLRGGDTVTGLVGVLDYTWAGNAASGNAYRIRPIHALGGEADFLATNPRPTSAPAVGGDLRVVGMNLLNFFNTLDTSPNNCRGGLTGALMDCRGANSAVEFGRQWPKTVAAVSGTRADVVAFMEIENDGYGPQSAVQFLVDQLNAKDGDDTWAFIDADARTGQVDALGNDAIKVGMLYKPANVTPIGQTAALNSVAFVNGGDSGPRSRPALAQAFEDNSSGGVFIAVANHLKSKGSPCDAPDAGDGQGNCNAVRTNAANRLVEWLATDPTGMDDSDVLLLGDMNSYAKEDPIAVFENGGFTNLIADRNGPDAYSFVFDGQWGYLDHALASASIDSQVTGVGDWHINSDEPSVLDYNTDFKTPNLVQSLYAADQFRMSDHDPVVVGLSLTNAAPVVGAVSGPSGAISVGVPVGVSAPFTDADSLDTHTATIAWGDGSSSAGTITGGTVNGSHTYTAAGIHTVTVTVTDEWGNDDSSSLESVVVYDRDAGFVNGGGWITSPRGALVSNPSHTGKASFQLVVAYSSGATTPSGSLTYSLAGAPFALATTSFDWLVVTGDTARFSGPATLNGSGGYRFSATVSDQGKSDTLRLVVTNSSGDVVYDSGVEAVKGQLSLH